MSLNTQVPVPGQLARYSGDVSPCMGLFAPPPLREQSCLMRVNSQERVLPWRNVAVAINKILCTVLAAHCGSRSRAHVSTWQGVHSKRTAIHCENRPSCSQSWKNTLAQVNIVCVSQVLWCLYRPTGTIVSGVGFRSMFDPIAQSLPEEKCLLSCTGSRAAFSHKNVPNLVLDSATVDSVIDIAAAFRQ